MLLARIKCPDRTEKKKIIWNSKKRSFTWNEKTYYIDPESIYTTYGSGSLMKWRTIDFIEGKSEPVLWYYQDDEPTEPLTNKWTPNLISQVFRKVLGYEKLDEILILLFIVVIIIGIVNVGLLIELRNVIVG